MKSPRSILSPRWSGFFILIGCGSTGFGISLGGSTTAVETALGLLALAAKGLPEEKEGDRFVLSLSASDQLNPSPISESVSRPNYVYTRYDRGGVHMKVKGGRPRLLPAVLAVPEETRR